MTPPICVITGASSGLGLATAAGIARAGGHVVLIARDPRRLATTAAQLRSFPGSVDTVPTDLARQDHIRHLAAELARRYDRIDILINNAGVLLPDRTLTQDGVEMTFAVNHLAPFRLTNLVKDQLHAGPAGRVITITSAVQRIGRLDFDDLQFTHRRYTAMAAYAQSKLANVLFTIELAQLTENSSITATCVHPGGARTSLDRNLRPPATLLRPLIHALSRPPDQAARPIIELALSPDLSGGTGRYYHRTKPRQPNPLSMDPTARRQLWDISTTLTHPT